jgi:hypothetical protein
MNGLFQRFNFGLKMNNGLALAAQSFFIIALAGLYVSFSKSESALQVKESFLEGLKVSLSC